MYPASLTHPGTVRMVIRTRALTGMLVQCRKPLHYWLKASVFSDVTGSCCARCGPSANCYVKNDGAFDFSGSVTVETVEYSTAKVTTALTQQLHLAAGAQTMQWLGAGAFPPAATHGLILTIRNGDSAHSVHSRNELILAPPINLTLPAVHVSAMVASSPSTDGSVDITLRSVGGAAVYVVLTTKAQVSCSTGAGIVQRFAFHLSASVCRIVFDTVFAIG